MPVISLQTSSAIGFSANHGRTHSADSCLSQHSSGLCQLAIAFRQQSLLYQLLTAIRSYPAKDEFRMSATPALPEDQARLLEDALIAVRQQTSLMRKCLDTPGKLMDALKCW
jgi:hypothetical protein